MSNQGLVLLIDGDILLYRCGFSCEYTTYSILSKEGEIVDEARGKKELKELLEEYPKCTVRENRVVEPLKNALHTVNLTIENMISKFQPNKVRVFLSGSNNFRNELYPIYKANRADVPRPVLYEGIREHLLRRYSAEVVNGEEADDALGKAQTDSSIICTIDKDLDCIPGAHYNFVKDNYYTVTPHEAAVNFYTQMLTGDGTDNICALRGVGPKTAEKILAKDPMNPHRPAMEAYEKYYGECWEEAWELNEELIGIRYE